MEAFKRSRDADDRNAVSIQVIGGVDGSGRRVVPGWPETEVDEDVRLLRLCDRDKARQPPVGQDDQAGRAMLDRRAQVLLLFGPPSMLVPLGDRVPVMPATPPKTLRTGAT